MCETLSPMRGFDAELYLRIAGEEMILGASPPGRRPWEMPLVEEAEALLAVGAISSARARAVIEDYLLAEAVRSDEGGRHHHMRAMARSSPGPRRAAVALKPRRVVPCDATIEDANGTLVVRHAILSEDETSLAVLWRASRTQAHRARRWRPMPGPSAGPPQPTLTDDRGSTASTGFSGGGSPEEWEGQLSADQPLAIDTAWIEIDGTRVALSAGAVPCEVRTEPVPEQRAAARYLWRCVATADFHGPPDIERAVDALLAAGALTPDDPELEDIRAVRDAMPHHGAPPSVRGGGRPLPEPWGSVVRRLGRQDGPEGMLALAALPPEFDGFSVAVHWLESRPEGFAIEAEIAPGLDGFGPFRGFASRRLAWWAGDEHGNHHLGQINQWSGGPHSSRGTIQFAPPLSPSARRLSIMPSGERSRAVISFPLSWHAAGGSSEGSRG